MQCSLPLRANPSLCAGADLLPLLLGQSSVCDSGQASLPALPITAHQHHTALFGGYFIPAECSEMVCHLHFFAVVS